ncbi:MAG TPA: hypothetical protein VGS62_04625 [Streptosporangiaceae bacterium]|nr:hypothetical protein [Streptosporangiaceae bacterium]
MSGYRSKITSSHRGRRCLVYVRQSTLAQTRANTENLERQYELAAPAELTPALPPTQCAREAAGRCRAARDRPQ